MISSLKPLADLTPRIFWRDNLGPPNWPYLNQGAQIYQQNWLDKICSLIS